MSEDTTSRPSRPSDRILGTVEGVVAPVARFGYGLLDLGLGLLPPQSRQHMRNAIRELSYAFASLPRNFADIAGREIEPWAVRGDVEAALIARTAAPAPETRPAPAPAARPATPAPATRPAAAPAPETRPAPAPEAKPAAAPAPETKPAAAPAPETRPAPAPEAKPAAAPAPKAKPAAAPAPETRPAPAPAAKPAAPTPAPAARPAAPAPEAKPAAPGAAATTGAAPAPETKPAAPNAAKPAPKTRPAPTPAPAARPAAAPAPGTKLAAPAPETKPAAPGAAAPTGAALAPEAKPAPAPAPEAKPAAPAPETKPAAPGAAAPTGAAPAPETRPAPAAPVTRISSGSAGATATTAAITIAHIEFKPEGRDVEGEYVLIRNTSTQAADMTGWKLHDGAQRHTYIFPPFVLAPGAEVKLWTRTGANDAANLYWGQRVAVWNNEGDTGTLLDARGAVVSRYTYSGDRGKGRA